MADNSKMIKNLFAGMQDALFLGDGLTRGEFTSFMQPGQFISTNLKQDESSLDMYTVSELANALVDTTYVTPFDEVARDDTRFIYRELIGSVDQVYRDVLQQTALPHADLDVDTLAEIEALREWMAQNEPNYTMYRERYYDSVGAFSLEAMTQNPNGARLQRLAAARDQAYRNWTTLGRRPVWESKYGRYVYLTAPDPATVWADLQSQLESQSKQTTAGQQYYQTFLSPSPSTWLGGAGWAHFEHTISESDTYEYSRQTSWSGGIGARWGLWSFGGGAGGSTNLQRSRSDVSSVQLAFDYMRVRIQRRWLVPDVFGYRFWTWRKTFGGQLLSDGGNLHVTPPVRPVGRMPVLPTHLIVVKNVTLSAAFSHEERELFERTVRYRASGGWGPFSVSGSYTESSRSQYTNASFDGTTFRIDQPQIIARTGILMPRCPNPDRSLSWQGDAWFPEDHDDQLFKSLRSVRDADYQTLLANEQLDEYRHEVGQLAERLLQRRFNQRELSTLGDREEAHDRDE